MEISIQEKKIILKNFDTECSIGIHDFEKENRQRVLINIEVHLVPRAAVSDDIESVLDYDFLRKGILEITRDRHFNLQETLCYEIVQLCFLRPQVSAVRVRTEKPQVYVDSESVGLEMFVQRPA